MQRLLHFGLYQFRNLVEHISRFMNPTALLDCFGKNFAQRFPKPQGTVADRQFGGMPQSLRFDTQQQLRPALFGFPITVFNGDKFFPSVFGDSNNNENALPGNYSQTAPK